MAARAQAQAGKAEAGAALDLTENALRVLERRYLAKDENGAPVETPEEMFRRVAAHIAKGDAPYAPQRLEETAREFYALMANLEFLPNSPTLMNAGRDLGQLSACFVLPVDDSLERIFETIKDTALIHKSGGGTGFAFSRLRPKGSTVRTTGGVSSGPVSFMKVFNAATEAIKQGGTRRGANMGILRVDHPDILEFITCKSSRQEVTNFNISVALTERFMQAVERDEEYELVEPHTKKVRKKLSARKVFTLMVRQAWQHGDPGIVFLDRINRDNPTPKLGEMESTNPCGEQPLLPYESCNLGSINLARMVRRVEAGDAAAPHGRARSRQAGSEAATWEVDWEKLRDTTWKAVHFLDNVVEVNNYPLPQIEAMTRANRRIGLGVMGFADMLVRLGIPYDSEEAIAQAKELMAFIHLEAKEASRELTCRRGAFPNFPGSLWDQQGEPLQRNSTVTTIAPTGTISIIAGCSSGVEPLFALSYWRNVMDNDHLVEVNPLFEEAARARGLASPELMEKVAERGGVRGLAEVPEDLQRLFATAHDITPQWHIRMQAAFQEFTDNAVSKTVNFPHDATEQNVAEVYRLAYKLGCKGVTIYRDGSREGQVLNLGKPGEQAAAPAGQAVAGRGLEKAAGAAKPGSGEAKSAELVSSAAPSTSKYASLRARSRRLQGDTERIPTADGDLYITLNRDDFGIAEVFLQLGKSGSLVNSLTEALGRIISIALRSGVDPQVIVKQLLGIQCGRQVWYDGELIQSVPDAIGKALGHHLKINAEAPLPARDVQAVSFLKAGPPATDLLAVCPDCSHMLEPLDGCFVCKNCGFSRCN
ncbi:MAG: vitamin B12-dependent ribonucleotide reductase [Candidatus Tectomicrobia bacterium]|nr:vitamin B12-dependent ribonucleotide reductase [Candidatus Tectomicrobia bacterium]